MLKMWCINLSSTVGCNEVNKVLSLDLKSLLKQSKENNHFSNLQAACRKKWQKGSDEERQSNPLLNKGSIYNVIQINNHEFKKSKMILAVRRYGIVSETEETSKHVFQIWDRNTDWLFTLQLGCFASVQLRRLKRGVLSSGKRFNVLTGRHWQEGNPHFRFQGCLCGPRSKRSWGVTRKQIITFIPSKIFEAMQQ